MSDICEGLRQKNEVLVLSIEEYKDVFVRTMQNMNTIVQVHSNSDRNLT